MKLCIWIVALLIVSGAQAQPRPHGNTAGITPASVIDTIDAIPLQVTQHLTTNLRFPAAIFRVDIGSGDVLAKKTGKTANILLLKAGRPGFPVTNISVYLDNGCLYSFLVSYTDTLTSFNYSFRDEAQSRPTRRELIFSNIADDRGRMEEDAKLVSAADGFMHVSASAAGLRLLLKGSYIKDSLLWLQLRTDNRSTLDCRPALLRCSEEDRRQWNRTATQSIGIKPAYDPGVIRLAARSNAPFAAGSNASFTAGNAPFTAGNAPFTAASSASFALGIQLPSMTKGKQLIIQWGEAEGRQVRLRIPSKKLLRSRQLN
jgi:hypothetical protein